VKVAHSGGGNPTALRVGGCLLYESNGMTRRWLCSILAACAASSSTACGDSDRDSTTVEWPQDAGSAQRQAGTGADPAQAAPVTQMPGGDMPGGDTTDFGSGSFDAGASADDDAGTSAP
jgi:hypothetical protein